MRPRGFALVSAVLLGLISSFSFSATRGWQPTAELIGVINMSPEDPLGGEIWTLNLYGKLVRRITKNNYHEEHPRFSPDGDRVVFVRNLGPMVPGVGIDPKYNEIFVLDLRTGKESRLTHNNVEDGHPQWSFDGKHIAFHSRRGSPEGRATLWIMESDGSRPRQILSLRERDASHLNPVWSPDGSWLAFVSYQEERGARFSRIERVRLDGTQRTVVSSGGTHRKSGTDEPWGDLDPAYSPEGAMIWCARRLEEGRTHLFSFGAGVYYGGKAETDMDWPVHPDGIERTPTFSPDGRRVVLTRSAYKAARRTRQIVITDPQSSFRRYITSKEEWDAWDPSWHPFAHSGADREATSTITRYGAASLAESKTPSPQGDRHGSVGRSLKSEGVTRLVGSLEPWGAKTATTAVYEQTWKLDVPPEKVTSLSLSLHGRFSAQGSLRFQFMDWEQKQWVTVSNQSEVSNDRVKILHEFAPASFISRDSQVALRILTSGASATSNPPLEIEHLSLDVRRN